MLRNVYIDKLGKILDEKQCISNKTIIMKSCDVETGTYISFDVENNNKNL